MKDATGPHNGEGPTTARHLDMAEFTVELPEHMVLAMASAASVMPIDNKTRQCPKVPEVVGADGDGRR